MKKDTRETPRPVAEKHFFQYGGHMGVMEKVARLLIVVTDLLHLSLGAATFTVIK